MLKIVMQTVVVMGSKKTYPIESIKINSNIEFYEEVIQQHKKGENYLLSFSWCKEIKRSFLYSNIGKVFCIFVIEIDNSSSPEDAFLWIIVGDIPSMYLDVFGVKTTVEAMGTYIELAENWINQIKNGQSVKECYPFNAEPTLELAELLNKKISFMKDTLIHHIDDIEFYFYVTLPPISNL